MFVHAVYADDVISLGTNTSEKKIIKIQVPGNTMVAYRTGETESHDVIIKVQELSLLLIGYWPMSLFLFCSLFWHPSKRLAIVGKRTF